MTAESLANSNYKKSASEYFHYGWLETDVFTNLKKNVFFGRLNYYFAKTGFNYRWRAIKNVDSKEILAQGLWTFDDAKDLIKNTKPINGYFSFLNENYHVAYLRDNETVYSCKVPLELCNALLDTKCFFVKEDGSYIVRVNLFESFSAALSQSEDFSITLSFSDDHNYVWFNLKQKEFRPTY